MAKDLVVRFFVGEASGLRNQCDVDCGGTRPPQLKRSPMGRTVEKDPLPRWKKEFEEFRGDICNLLLSIHTYQVMDDAVRDNPAIKQGDPVLYFTQVWYYQYVAATVRRHVREHKQSHGLIRLLKQVRQRPELVGTTVADVDWDLQRLEAGTKAIEEYADKTVAHLDRKQMDVLPTVNNAKDAVTVIGSIFNKYEGRLLGREAFNPALVLEGHWTNALDVAWRRITVLPNKRL